MPTMPASNKPSIVIYGGTFNPVHNGHLYPAIESAQFINADKLIYLPCHIPPHKEQPNVSSMHRLQMTKLAIANVAAPTLNIEVSDYELKQNTPSYTRKTIEYFYNLFPNHQLYFLIGMDSLNSFHLWFKWQEILDYCQLLVMQRPGYTYNKTNINKELQPYLKNKVTFSNANEVDVSSSQIKASFNVGLNVTNTVYKDITRHIPQLVQDYITQHELYK